MRRLIVGLAALCLFIALPASMFGAMPSGTTKLSGAGAAFVAEDGGVCYRATITFLYDRFRAVQPEQTPPGYYAQLTLSMDEDTTCSGNWTEVEETQGQGFEEGDTYLMNDLASAYVDIDWHAFADTPDRHFHLWLAWVADGTPTQVVDVANPSKSIRQEVGAQLAGTVTEDGGGLTWAYEPGSASMGLGTYIFEGGGE
jgi:hypothetical protein